MIDQPIKKPAFGEIWMRLPDRAALLGWLEGVLPSGPQTITAIDENAFDPKNPMPLLMAIGDPKSNPTLAALIDQNNRKTITEAVTLLERRNKADYLAALTLLKGLISR